MTTALCIPGSRTMHSNAAAVESARIAEPALALSPRLTDLLDWLNREWDEQSESAEPIVAAIAD